MSFQPNIVNHQLRSFGSFTLDESVPELRKHGIPVRLKGQPIQILGMLVRRPAQVISRDEFQAELWQGSTFVDFDHGLNAAMNRLRQALSDSADRPRFIETIPGSGYRFIAPVDLPHIRAPLVLPAPRTSDAQPEPKAAAVPSRTVITRGPRYRAIAALSGILFLAAVIGVLAFWPIDKAPAIGNLLVFAVSPPPGFSLEAASSRQTFAISPDGTKLAFSAMNSRGIFHLFLRGLNELETRPVLNSEGSYHTFWAPDSASLFTTVRGSLRRTRLSDNAYQAICRTPPIFLTGAVAGSDILLSAREATYVVPAAGGIPKRVEGKVLWPQLLPGGKYLLYTHQEPLTGNLGARVAVWRSGMPKSDLSRTNLVDTESRVVYVPSVAYPGKGYLLYTRAGNLLAHPFDPQSLRPTTEPIPIASRIYTFQATGAADFSVSDNGVLVYGRYLSRSQLAWVDRRGNFLRAVGPANVNVKHGRVSPDGKKIGAGIFDVERGFFEIWIIDTETGASRKAISTRGQVDNVVWSPDSQRFAHNFALDSPPTLRFRGLGQQDQEERLPVHQNFEVPTDWSPDGRFVLFNNSGFSQIENDTQGEVTLVDMARGRAVIPLIRSPHHEANAMFSPDGKWIAFSSTETGRAEVYLQRFTGGDSPRLIGDRHLISRLGAVALRWRRDGKELLFLAFDGRVHAVPITLEPGVKVGEAVPLFSISTEARAAIHSLSGFDISPDGQRLLVPLVNTTDKSELVVVQNWEAKVLQTRSPR